MIVLTVLGQKGGSGKSTIACNLAVLAPCALIDMDPQGSAAKWAARREADNPGIVTATTASLAKILHTAADHVPLAVIDTPPRMEANAIAAVRAASLAIIPIRPQVHDLETIPATLKLLKAAGSPPAAVILNQVPFFGIRHEQARRALIGQGLTVFRTTLGSRAIFGDAAAIGQGVTEAGYSKARTEMLNLWAEIRALSGYQEPRT